MIINQTGSTVAPQIDSTKYGNDSVNVKSEAKTPPQRAVSIQDRVEISQTGNMQKNTETEKISDAAQAQSKTEQLKTQIESNPYQAMFAQGNNMTAARVANLL